MCKHTIGNLLIHLDKKNASYLEICQIGEKKIFSMLKSLIISIKTYHAMDKIQQMTN